MLTPIMIPSGIDDAQIRAELLNRFSIEIGGGLGEWAGKVWRIGLMGHSSSEENVDRVLAALKALL